MAISAASADDERILVIGGSGFVGGHLLVGLRRAMPKARLIATAMSLPEVEDIGISWCRLDVTDRKAVDDLIETAKPTVLVHLAALSTYQSSALDPDLAWKVNVEGTRYLAAACVKRAPSCRFLHVSSGEVYGHSCNRFFPITEDAPLDPGNVYAATKAAADIAIGEMTLKGLNAIRVRPFNHTGPGQGEALFVPAVAAQIARAEAGLAPPVIKVGNLNAARDFLDVRDVVEIYIRLIQNWASLPPRAIFNIASGEAVLMSQVLDDLLAMATTPLTIEQDASRMRPSEVPRIAGDATRLRDLLQWQPRYPFVRTLRDVLADWRAKVTAGGSVSDAGAR